MKKLLFVALVCLLAIPAFASPKASAKIINGSSWDIHHLYLSPVSEDRWGPDQLGYVVLESGSSFTITRIPCDEYDVKVVDEDGDECVIEQVDICGGENYWKITDDDLLDCEGYGD